VFIRTILKSTLRRTPGPDLACNAYAVFPGLINNIEIAIFAKEVAPGRAGQASTLNLNSNSIFLIAGFLSLSVNQKVKKINLREFLLSSYQNPTRTR